MQLIEESKSALFLTTVSEASYAYDKSEEQVATIFIGDYIVEIYVLPNLDASFS